MRVGFILFIVLFFLTASLVAQYAGKVEYGIEDGVINPNSNLFCDSKGRIWVGSNSEGLNVFDGQSWTNFSTHDGLMPNRTNPRFEDKEGGLWISQNDSGVCRYTNGRFQQYQNVSPSTKNIKKGIKRFPHSSFVQPLFYDKKKELPVTFTQDSTKQFWIHEFDYTTQSFDLEGYPFFEEAILKKYAPFMTYKDLRKSWLYVDWKGDYYVAVSFEQETHLVYQDGSIIRLPINNILGPNWLMPDGKGSYHFYQNEKKQLLRLEDSKWVPYPSPDLQRYGASYKKTPVSFTYYSALNREYGSNNLYTLWKVEDPTLKDHFILAEHAPFTNKITHTLLVEGDENDRYSLYLIKDKAGTYWYKSGQKIVRLFPDQMIIPNKRQGMPSDIWAIAGTPQGKIWLASFSSTPNANKVGLHVFDGLQLEEPPGELSAFYSFSEGSLVDQEDFTYFINNSYYDTLRHGILKFKDTASYEILCQGKRGFYLDLDKKGQLLYVTQRDGLWLLSKDKKGLEQRDWFKINQNKGLKMTTLRTALQDNKGNYWMGGHKEGLAVYLPDRDTVYNWILREDVNNPVVRCMAEDAKGNLWLGTGKGLCFYENSQVNQPDLDLKNNIQKVAIAYIGESNIEICKLYDEHTLIIGNRKGFFLLDLDAWYAHPRQLLLHPFTASNGHQGKGVLTNGIWIDDNKDVWMVCKNGVVRYTPNLLPRDTIMPSVTIDSFQVGEKIITNFSKKIKLGPTESTVRIYFSQSINSLLLDNTLYRYRLKGEAWSSLLKEGYIDYRNLGAGNYTFEVLADKNGLRSPPASIQFQISPVLWQNLWFWLAIFGFLIIIGLFFRQKEIELQQNELNLEKNRMRMNNIVKEKEKFRMEAILNQLNPHFINNALQWLQIRLDNQGDEEGVAVVGKLSENIRAVFKNSRAKKVFHSILDELRLTENYLYVQKRRFGTKLNYKMPNQASLQDLEGINIPMLMIQIHVENAIEHGLRNKLEGGTIRVSCKKETDFVFITIEDDGLGRKVAQKMGSYGTGNGVKMLKEMESFYNQQNELPISQVYEDGIFMDKNEQQYGTRLLIQVPLNYNYD